MSNHQGTDGVDDLLFVTGGIRHQPRGVRVQVRVGEPPGSYESDSQADAAARTLTLKIKQAKSATELLDLLDAVVDGRILNRFHASAAYHSMANWKRKGGLTPREKKSPVLPRLAARVQRMTEEGQVGPRELANVLYSLGKLYDDLDISKGLLMALVKSLGEKARGMEPQGLSNSLLACVQLKGVAPEVLTALPKLAAQISIKAKDMVPQALSNSLWAFAHLKDDACHADVAKIVAALVGQIRDKANGMKPQELSNSLWAAAQLKDIAPDVKEMVPAIVAQIQDNPKNMNPQDLSNNLWAAAQLKDTAPGVKEIVPAIVAQIQVKASDMVPQALSNCLWAATQLRDVAPDVKEIVPAIVTQIQEKANGMIPQALSNSLWAATRLQESAPEVLQMVPSLLVEIPRKQASFSSQEICNCLEALVILQDSVPAVGNFLAAATGSKNDFLGFAAKHFSTLLPTLKGKSLQLDIAVVVWACARVKLYHEELLLSVADRLKSGRALKTLPDWGLCALLWSYDVLDSDGRFATFKETLGSDRVRRELADSDVSKSQSGYFDWKRAKG